MQRATTRPARPRAQKSKPISKSHTIRKTKRTMTTTKKSPCTTITTTSSAQISTPSTLPHTVKQPSILCFKMKKFRLVNPISQSVFQFSTTHHRAHSISLEQVLTDLQLESLIPTIQSPPELQSLLLHRSKHPQEKSEITLFHLVILSPGDFRQLFPNDIHRNRLKEHVRTLIGGKPLTSDGVQPISYDEFKNIVHEFVHSQHISETEPGHHTKVQFVEPAAASPVSDVKQPQTTTTTTPPATTPQSATSSPAETTLHDVPAEQSDSGSESSSDAAAMAEKSLAEETLKISIQCLKMPSFFDAMKTGSIQEWHVKVGEHFTRGQVLCDIDTEIAELSFEAPEPGHLSEILVGTGSSVNVGDAIAVMRYQEDH